MRILFSIRMLYFSIFQVRQCLAESEPITFLKCDQACHDKVLGKEEPTTPKPLHLKPNKKAKEEDELASVCVWNLIRCRFGKNYIENNDNNSKSGEVFISG